MTISKKLGLAVGLALSFIALCFLFVSIGFSAIVPGGHTPLQWVIGLTTGALPFLFTFWIVYRCYCTDEMEYWDILGIEVRPQALKRAIFAELGICAGIVMLWLACALIIPYLARLLAA